MKSLAPIVCLLTVVVIFCWLGLEMRAKAKYDQAREENSVVYSLTPMDQKTVDFLAQVQSDWRCWSEVTNGPDADALKLVGRPLLVHDLIEMYNYQMPPFHWFSPSRNREAAAQNLVKAKFMPVSLDKQWHVSADGHTAFLLCKSNMVALYRDGPSGLRASYYVARKDSPMPRAEPGR